MPEGKIKSKDLTYENTLPPFLQKLHAQNAGRGDQDRHERPIARPKRAKAPDDEDQPTVVDEAGETVSKAELEKMTSATDSNMAEEDSNVKTVGDEDSEPVGSGAIQDGLSRNDQKVTDGAATKKRKVAKVVGDDGEGDEHVQDDAEPVTKKPVKKAKKKAKPIKLAFDDDEET